MTGKYGSLEFIRKGKLNTEVGMISATNKVSATLTPEVIEENIPDDEDDKKYNVCQPKLTCHILNQNKSK